VGSQPAFTSSKENPLSRLIRARNLPQLQNSVLYVSSTETMVIVGLLALGFHGTGCLGNETEIQGIPEGEIAH
jgi:hypothetical protein